MVRDGRRSIRKAVAQALPGAPHQLCQFHYPREASRPIHEADRHAKVQLKKRVRGVRPIEREVEGRDDAEAQAVRGYCAAVRGAITDDGRPPLEASGLKPRDRVAEKGGLDNAAAEAAAGPAPPRLARDGRCVAPHPAGVPVGPPGGGGAEE